MKADRPHDLVALAKRVRGHVDWRLRRMKTSLAASRTLDGDRLLFLGREILRRPRTATYKFAGQRVRMTHHTEDVAAFKELFVVGVYDLSPEWGTFAAKKIADLGGNVGMFALHAAIQWPGVPIVAFEPDPTNAAKYRWQIANNAFECQLIEACAGAAGGTVRFATGKQAHSHITNDADGVELPVVDVFPYLAGVDVLKMDIEGGEWPILVDDRFASNSAGVLMMEYHRHMCPEPNPKVMVSRILNSAGYEIRHLSWDDRTGSGELHARRR